jgi:hypothetical protein
MTTLSEYEAGLVTAPSWERGLGAGPAYALRAATAQGEAFTTARDRIVNTQQHRTALTESENLAVFAALTGP